LLPNAGAADVACTDLAANFLQQQARFDKFIKVFNHERPHEALDMKCPAEVYQPSPRSYAGLPDIDYPFHDKTIVVTRCGRICLGNKKINFSQVFAGQAVGIKALSCTRWHLNSDRSPSLFLLFHALLAE